MWAALAGASALMGVGLAWRKFQPQAVTPGVESELWALTFLTPQGQTLRMASLRGQPILLNFWATWCPPCVEELPLLNGFYKENVAKGWQVLGLAVDQQAPVQRFLAQSPLAFPVAMAGMPGLTLSKSLGNVSASLPFSVVLGVDGQVLHRKMGKLNQEDLQAWATLT